jgi:acetolactate decarboxylase
MKLLLHIISFILLYLNSQAQLVKYSGAMRKIHQDKQVDASILIDTIKAKNLYALGPVENLRGEIIIWNNNAFVAALTEDGQPYVQKNVKNLKAIFLVYADVDQWDTILLRETQINSIADLETLISRAAHNQNIDTSIAFPFQIYARASNGHGHIMFKDTSATEITTEVLEKARTENSFTDQYIQMLGFYSQHHQSIFTHHNTYLHIHYRLRNKYQAGHLEHLKLDPDYPIKLLLPKKSNP